MIEDLSLISHQQRHKEACRLRLGNLDGTFDACDMKNEINILGHLLAEPEISQVTVNVFGSLVNTEAVERYDADRRTGITQHLDDLAADHARAAGDNTILAGKTAENFVFDHR